jgi:hypothetical protein
MSALEEKADVQIYHPKPTTFCSASWGSIVAEIEADMAAQLERVREMERNGELEPIPEISATAQ